MPQYFVFELVDFSLRNFCTIAGSDLLRLFKYLKADDLSHNILLTTEAASAPSKPLAPTKEENKTSRKRCFSNDEYANEGSIAKRPLRGYNPILK